MPTEPQVVFMPGGVRTEIHLDGSDTDGAFCLLVDHPPAGWALPPHLHTDAAETIGMEEFFREAGSASAEIDADRTATAEAAVRYGWQFV